MKFKTHQPTATDYYTLFSCSNSDRKYLFQFINFIFDDNAYEKILNDSTFSPSHVWKNWLSSTIIGFSYDSVLFKSGHRFINSFTPIIAPSFSDGKIKSFIRNALKSIRTFYQIYRSDTVTKHINKFNAIYPNSVTPLKHHDFINLHPFPYLRALEILNLSEIDPPKYVFEVGAGACTNIALLRNLYKTKSLVVDLPDTIFAGYLFLKSLFPDIRIALPHDVKNFDMDKFDVVFLMPYQIDIIPNNFFDVAYNMSSFQEMEIDVVNNYLSLIHNILKSGGNVILCNQEVSRYIEGNSFLNYQLGEFVKRVMKNPKYSNFETRDIRGIQQFFYQARKA